MNLSISHARLLRKEILVGTGWQLILCEESFKDGKVFLKMISNQLWEERGENQSSRY